MALNENAKKWVEALRSGKYEQGQLALQNGNKFCCLGVACEVSGLKVNRHDTGAIQGVILPFNVKKWLGLIGHTGGHLNSEGQFETLSGLNDNGKTFSELADLIESEPEGLFASGNQEQTA